MSYSGLTIGDIFTITKGKKHEIVDSQSIHSKRVIGIDDLRNDNLIRFTDDEKGTEVFEDDILIAWDGANAGTIGYGKHGFIGSTIARLRFKESGKFCSPYVGMLLKSKFDYLRQTATGATIPHISRKALEKILVPDMSLGDQKRISILLGKTESLIHERKQSLEQLDELLKSVFLDMFGDPVRNEKGWDQPPLKMFGQVSTGNTPPRKDSDNYSEDYIEWIKTDNIPSDSAYISDAVEHLSEKGSKKGRAVSSGALLVACIAGSIESIGRAALTNRKVAFNQQINAIQPNSDVNSFYLYVLFLVVKSYIQSHATKGMKKIITKGEFEKISLIKPPIELQNKFSMVVEKILKIKDQYQSNLSDLQTLYNALSQKAFSGELDLSGIQLQEEADLSSFDKLQQSIDTIDRFIPEPVKRVTETVNKIIPPSVQRLSKQIEALPQIPENTLRTLKFLSEHPEMQIYPFSYLDLFGFNDPKTRQQILEHWFNEWLEDSQADELKLYRFWARAQRSLVDYLYEEDLEEYQFTVEDYDAVKTLVFQAIDNGLIKQTVDTVELNDKSEAGNRVVLVKG